MYRRDVNAPPPIDGPEYVTLPKSAAMILGFLVVFLLVSSFVFGFLLVRAESALE